MTTPKLKPRSREAVRSDPRYVQIPIACAECKHLKTAGSQFDDEGWTCTAYQDRIPYTILTRREEHTTPRPWQDKQVAYEPKIHVEQDTGREWYYNFDGSWTYVDGLGEAPDEED